MTLQDAANALIARVRAAMGLRSPSREATALVEEFVYAHTPLSLEAPRPLPYLALSPDPVAVSSLLARGRALGLDWLRTYAVNAPAAYAADTLSSYGIGTVTKEDVLAWREGRYLTYRVVPHTPPRVPHATH